MKPEHKQTGTLLRSGYTTGACAAAAAKGAAQMLISQTIVSEVCIELPAGISAVFGLHGQFVTLDEAGCCVIKFAGDDPDVTNGAEVCAVVKLDVRESFSGAGVGVIIEGGVGIGKVTKPGLAVPPGEWAINPVPRRMIEEAVAPVIAKAGIQHSVCRIIISIPDGEERAVRTLNARLGIVGGLSILGTTGIVRPISAKAWTDTIDAALDVAGACGCTTVVLSTGRSSEITAQKHLPDLPEEAFVMMGDHVAYALQACAKRGFMKPVIACQFAKLLKIACGHSNTHAAASVLDLALLYDWAIGAEVSGEYLAIIARANTAREIAVATCFDRTLMGVVADRACKAAEQHASGIKAAPLLCGYDGAVII